MKMDDLKRRLRDVEGFQPPDLWNDITDREPTHVRPEPGSGHRIAVIVLAFTIAVAGFAFGVRAFDRDTAPRSTPTPTSHAPQPSFDGALFDRATFPNDQVSTLGSLVVGDDSLWAIDGGAMGPDRPAGVVRIDPATGTILSRTDLNVTDLAFGDAALWAVGHPSQGKANVYRIDQATGEVTDEIPLPNGTYGGPIAVLGGSVWVGGVMPPPGGDWDHADRVLFQIDAEAKTIVAQVPVDHCSPFDGGCVPNTELLVADGALWVRGTEHGTVERVDPDSGEVTTFADAGDAGLAVGDGSLWVVSRGPGVAASGWWSGPTQLIRIDESTGRVVGDPVTLAGGSPDPLESAGAPIGVTGDTLWVAGTDDAMNHVRVAAFDLRTMQITRSVNVFYGDAYGAAVVDAEHDSIWFLGHYEIVRIPIM
jgi:hypothetical protein